VELMTEKRRRLRVDGHLCIHEPYLISLSAVILWV
jgi:hypothetical protein